jgi:hypothetical protein
MPVSHVIQRCLTFAVGSVGLAWGIFVLPTSEAADDYRYLQSKLLHSETYNLQTLALKVASAGGQGLSDCDAPSQTALLLMEMRLAQAALRAGAANEFDQRDKSIELRAKRVLSCAPRQSFVWLVAFSLKIMHGQLNEQSLNQLAMSYETSPNEGWISIRRNIVALPLVLQVPKSLQNKIVAEFQQLIQNGFVSEAATSYSATSASVRSLLQPAIERLDGPRQKAFWDALQRNYS